MREQVFFCGLSESQRRCYGAGKELNLRGAKANVRLNVEKLRGKLGDVEPELVTDLLEIAVYVFAADCAVPRGGPALKNVGERWRRAFRLVIAVRRPGSWAEPQYLDALREALQFLTEDTWDVEFVELENPPSIQTYLGSWGDAEDPKGATILLLSGGLDSFAGAVAELNGGGRVVLLSRRLTGMTNPRQSELARALQERYPERVIHASVEAGLTINAKAQEHSQRTRSFLLASMALVAAVLEGSERIRFYENGIMSLNLPISAQVVGARASRSTHPRSLMLLQELVSLISASEMKIDNPFVWKTKADVVRELSDEPEARLIARTLSCSRTREMSHYNPHCGRCAQCLHRRIAVLGAGASDFDPAESYGVDFLIGPRQLGEDRAMAVDIIRSALEFRRLSETEFATRFAGELAWLTTGFPSQAPDETVRRAIDVFRRHGEEVGTIFRQAARDRADALIDGSLPESCLLRMVINSPATALDDTGLVSGPPTASTEEESADGSLAPDEIFLALDEVEKHVLIDNIAPLTSPGEYRIVSVLLKLFREDRQAELDPANYRTLSAAELAAEIGEGGDQNGRKAISRLRHKIDREHLELYGSAPGLEVVIETVKGKGYRLNPSIRIVAPGQIRRGTGHGTEA